MKHESGDLAACVVDLTDISLADLAALEHPRLNKALQRVLEQVTQQEHQIVAGFGSAI